MTGEKTGMLMLLAILLWSPLFLQAGELLPAGSSGEADLVWSQGVGGRHVVLYSRLEKGKWRPVEQVSDDYRENLHPVVDRDSLGRSWIFWTALDDTGLAIRYTVGNQGNWSVPATVPSELRSNIAPSVIIDQADTVHVVWAGNDGGLDDIYHSLYSGGSWSDPERIHPENHVPDVLPRVDIDAQGRVEVTWKQFRDGQYRLVRSVSRGTDGWTAPVLITAEQQQEKRFSEKVAVPDFVGSVEKAFVRMY